MPVVVITLGLMIFSLVAGHPREKSTHPLELRVNQIMSMSAPALIRLVTRVEPDADNRQICVFAANSEGTYETSSCRDLEGAASMATIEWGCMQFNRSCGWWMPAGHYKALAVLTTTSGKPIQTTLKFEIAGSAE